jgi:hypothetical protein
MKLGFDDDGGGGVVFDFIVIPQTVTVRLATHPNTVNKDS